MVVVWDKLPDVEGIMEISPSQSMTKHQLACDQAININCTKA